MLVDLPEDPAQQCPAQLVAQSDFGMNAQFHSK
jgi:hypothetical protein